MSHPEVHFVEPVVSSASMFLYKVYRVKYTNEHGQFIQVVGQFVDWRFVNRRQYFSFKLFDGSPCNLGIACDRLKDAIITYIADYNTSEDVP